MIGEQPKVQIGHISSIPVAVVRRQVRGAELAKVVPEGCGIVWNFVRARQLKGGRNIAIYWDGGIRLEVGVELADPFTEDGEVVRSATPAGQVASIAHFGPYGTMDAAHKAILAFCGAIGHRLAGPSWEIYGHWQDEWNANPSLIRTDIFYLLASDDS